MMTTGLAVNLLDTFPGRKLIVADGLRVVSHELESAGA
nr:hypothetical protein JVH1_8883 [Rhodococcus sp. JVH1]